MKTTPYSQRIRADKASLWGKKEPVLRKLDLELTERCNNNCIHCCISLPVDEPKALKRELSAGEIKKILREAAALGCLRVRFTGGEPLLRGDFEEIYVFARRLGLRVLIFTNATLITPRTADLLSRIPPLEKIEVTLYGMRRENYEAISRTPGSYEAAWRGISLLLEKKIPFIVKGTLLFSDRDKREKFQEWATGIPWMNSRPGYSSVLTLSCRRDPNKNRLIKSLRFSPEEFLRYLIEENPEFFREIKHFSSKFMGIQGKTLFSCGAGVGSGCVDAYGSFQLCLMLRHPRTVYDLKQGSLQEALTSFFPEVRKLEAKDAGYLKHCSACFLRGFCLQCPAWSWMEHGTLDSRVEYLCKIAHAQARHVGLLKKNENAWEISDWKARLRNFSAAGKFETKKDQDVLRTAKPKNGQSTSKGDDQCPTVPT